MNPDRAILHDEKTYPDPERLLPERWLGKEKDFPDAAFGSGRRHCTGKQLSREWMFITFASILATYNVSKAVDASGKEIEPVDDYSATVFRCATKSYGRSTLCTHACAAIRHRSSVALSRGLTLLAG